MRPLYSQLFLNFYIIETNIDSVTQFNVTILTYHAHLNYLGMGGAHGYPVSAQADNNPATFLLKSSRVNQIIV